MAYIPSGRSLKSLDDAMLRHDGSVPVSGPIDFNYNEARHLILGKEAKQPTVRREGLIYFNQQTKTAWLYNGITFQELICRCNGSTTPTPGPSTPTVIASAGELYGQLTPTGRLYTFKTVADPFESYLFSFKNYISEEGENSKYADVGEIGSFFPMNLKHKSNGVVTGSISPSLRIGCIMKTYSSSETVCTYNDYTNGLDGVEVIHNLGNIDHKVMVSSNFFYDPYFQPSFDLLNRYMADAGVYWVQLGENVDIVYNTGSKGLKFDYYATTDNIMSLSMHPNRDGAVFTHNFGHRNRITTYTLTTNGPITADRIADVGDIYVVMGNSYDRIYLGMRFQ